MTISCPVATLFRLTRPSRTPTWVDPGLASMNQSVERTAATPVAVSTSKCGRPVSVDTTARSRPSPSDSVASRLSPLSPTRYSAIVTRLPDATAMTEPSFIRSFSFAPAATSRVSPACTGSPSLSGSRRPVVSTKHCPKRASTSPACAGADAAPRIPGQASMATITAIAR